MNSQYTLDLSTKDLFVSKPLEHEFIKRIISVFAFSSQFLILV